MMYQENKSVVLKTNCETPLLAVLNAPMQICNNDPRKFLECPRLMR
jgi:hypothetical protein